MRFASFFVYYDLQILFFDEIIFLAQHLFFSGIIKHINEAIFDDMPTKVQDIYKARLQSFPWPP
jgi:hypothetical protein